LAEIIAKTLGWPLLKLDPSHLTRDGLDRLHAETHRVFTMLAACEQVVVLMDEFDELVLARSDYYVESSSRFLTTAMLPKIAALADRRRIVYILATNRIERFDDAISRPGRFDLILPIMPPTLPEKLRKWTTVAARLGELGLDGQNLPPMVAESLADLTFLEFKLLAPELSKAKNQTHLEELVQDAVENCTMRQKIGTNEDAPTWKEELSQREILSRIRTRGPS
jgi:SpoVK/Ycf46/Vps4 family AAA+-type ATPase